MDFEWDAVKAAENAAIHGVTFIEAAEVFADDLASTVADPDYSIGEGRCLLFGTTAAGRAIVVALAERGARIRIISARPMTRRERGAYEQ